MNPSSGQDSDSPPSAAGEIDRLCDAFESAWRSERRPPIEKFLAQARPTLRGALLHELLQLEIELRLKRGESIDPDEYVLRFPAEAPFVESLLERRKAPRRLGDYELLEELGRGGMGVVYRARQIFLNQIVALKVLPERYLDDSQVVARFKREMQLIGGLDHPNIVRAYNAGEAQGRHYLATEYVEGLDCQRLVRYRLKANRGPLEIAAACEIVRQAATGLQHAAEQGLVHRDIKPANLMLHRSGLVKILDMGLARFRADLLAPHPASELTQTGVTMGTVDYMAPEQWEDSSSVDVRADIYSLGCTLYYLLTGRAPYVGQGLDTPAKKMLAHLSAPVPPLDEPRPDCPAELCRLAVRMMAKGPADRPASPAEVADMVEKWAGPEELATVAAEAASGELPPSDPNVSTGNWGTAPPLRQSKGHTAGTGSFFMPGRRTVVGVLVAAALMLAAAIGYRLAPQAGPAPLPTPAPATPGVAADLALLPGLNGQWWFDEMPWYLPFAREALAKHLDGETAETAILGSDRLGYLNPNVVEVHRWLWQAVAAQRGALNVAQARLMDDLKRLADAELGDRELAAPLEQALRAFEAQPPVTALDRYAAALVRHKIANLRGDRRTGEAALAAYDEALRQFDDRGPASLRWLCLADSARLAARVADFAACQARFEEALGESDASPIFRAETLAAWGDEAAQAGEYQDVFFAAARKAWSRYDAMKRVHPLAAHISERHAWSLMEQWQVREAARWFEEAYNIRWTNGRQSQNPLAGIYQLHNRHGMAIALRYGGKTDAARAEFQRLVGDSRRGGDIQAALVEAKAQRPAPGRQRLLRDLAERLANSLERYADCELYGGAADAAGVELARAARQYDEARGLTNDLTTRAAMTAKMVLSLALGGQVAAARAAFDGFKAERHDDLGPDRPRAELLLAAAEAVLVLKERGAADGRAALTSLLDRFRLNPAYAETRRRENLELQLLLAELLLALDREQAGAPLAPRDLARYLDPLLTAFPARQEMLPYLRRYYDLAIRVTRDVDVVLVAQYVLQSRAGARQDQLRKGGLLLFYLDTDENFAILLPPQGAGELFALPYTRVQVRQAAARGQKLALPEGLARRVKEESAADRPLEISWDDTACWARQDDGLGPRHWPFGDQLPLP